MSLTPKEFREKVEKEIEGWPKEKQVAFGWRTAVRALPFLGELSDFSYWKENESQKHLLAIFRALDFARTAYASDASAAYASAASAAAYASAAYASAASAASDAAYASAYASAASDAAYASAAYASASAAFAASDAAYASDAASASASDAASASASDAADAASDAASASTAKVGIQDIVWGDIRAIKNGVQPTISIDDYGDLWPRFIRALENEGCGYWARLYEGIFQNNFYLDERELERRLSLPQEILARGAAEVGRYLEKLKEEGGGEILNEARIIIIGEKGAGKTSLARRLKKPDAKMPEKHESTRGVETSIWRPEGSDLNIRIWDFAGHAITHTTHQFFLSARCLYIIVYDGRSENRNRLHYWLDQVKNYGGDSKIVVVVNKRDGSALDLAENKLQQDHPIVGFYTFNIEKEQEDLVRFRKALANTLTTDATWHQGQILRSHFEVKEELEQKFEEGEELLNPVEFNQIIRKYKIENKDGLLRDLHDLGIGLSYSNVKGFEDMVLNPEWITTGVYEIINWAAENKRYAVHPDDGAAIFEDHLKRFPQEKQHYFFGLMCNYQLAYQKDTGGQGAMVIPYLLPEDQPPAGEMPRFKVGESLQARFEFNHALPPDTISRFIVKHHPMIRKLNGTDQVWKYGVILKQGDSLALVEEEDRFISISVSGKDKTDFLDQLRTSMQEIFQSYKSEQPELQYNLKEYGEKTGLGSEKDYYVDEKTIVDHERKGRPLNIKETGGDVTLKELRRIFEDFQIEKDRKNWFEDFKRAELKRWQGKGIMPLVLCAIIAIVVVTYFLILAEGDGQRALNEYWNWQKGHIVNWGLTAVYAVFLSVSITIFVLRWFNESQKEAFLRKVKLPE